MSADDLEIRAPTNPEIVWVPANHPGNAKLRDLVAQRDEEIEWLMTTAADVIADLDTELQHEKEKNRAA